MEYRVQYLPLTCSGGMFQTTTSKRGFLLAGYKFAPVSRDNILSAVMWKHSQSITFDWHARRLRLICARGYWHWCALTVRMWLVKHGSNIYFVTMESISLWSKVYIETKHWNDNFLGFVCEHQDSVCLKTNQNRAFSKGVNQDTWSCMKAVTETGHWGPSCTEVRRSGSLQP